MSLTARSRSSVGSLALALVATALAWVASPASSLASPLVAVEPARLVETRLNAGAQTVDGESFGEGRLGAGEVRSFVAAGRADVSSGATSVVLNVTIVAPADAGYATVFPCPSGNATADDAPNASSVNMRRGRTVANSLLVRVGQGGRVCVYSSVAAHLVVDVSGFGNGESPVALSPVRLVETRSSAIPTVDGDFTGAGALRAGEIYRFGVAGRAGVPANADAAALNVAAVRPTDDGFLTVFPCPAGSATASDVPTASNLNFVAGQNVANSVMTSLGDGGDVCILASVATHLVIDANGYVPSGGDPRPFPPIRLLETRTGARSTTVDGRAVGIGELQAGSITPLAVAGRSVIESNAAGFILNVTAIAPRTQGFLTLFPCPAGQVESSDVPVASNVNFSAGQTVANSALVASGAGGQVCIFTSATTHLAIDASAAAPAVTTPGDDPVSPTPTTPATTASTTTTVPSTPPTTPGSQPPTTGPHAFSAMVRGEPVRWDPCSTITYKLDASRGTQADIDQLNSAIARVEQATGLDFVSMGSYSATYSPSSARSPSPSSPSGAEVGLTLTDNDVATDFANGLLGYAIIQWSGGNGEIVRGTVTLDATPGAGIDKELVWMHELAHLVGLGHINAAGELMQPRYDGTLDDFGNGDREGLWRLGAAQPCLFTDMAADPDLQRTFHAAGGDDGS